MPANVEVKRYKFARKRKKAVKLWTFATVSSLHQSACARFFPHLNPLEICVHETERSENENKPLTLTQTKENLEIQYGQCTLDGFCKSVSVCVAFFIVDDDDAAAVVVVIVAVVVVAVVDILLKAH